MEDVQKLHTEKGLKYKVPSPKTRIIGLLKRLMEDADEIATDRNIDEQYSNLREKTRAVFEDMVRAQESKEHDNNDSDSDSDDSIEAEFVARARAIARSHNDDSMTDIISSTNPSGSGALDKSRFATRLASSMPVPENPPPQKKSKKTQPQKKINYLLFSCHY
ncbi:unnamed protein product [Rhizopus stolonifer]